MSDLFKPEFWSYGKRDRNKIDAMPAGWGDMFPFAQPEDIDRSPSISPVVVGFFAPADGQYVAMLDEYDQFTGFDPTVGDVLTALHTRGYEYTDSQDHALTAGKVILNTLYWHHELFCKGLEDARSDPDLAFAVADERLVWDAENAVNVRTDT